MGNKSNTKPKIITVGAAVQDVFLSGKVLKPKKEEDGSWVEEFPLGSKMDLDGITFSTGGGATNAAVTFARQGMKVSFMGKIAHDPAGMAVVSDLHNDGVDTSKISYSKKYSTGYSALLLSPTGERTILTYRGASTHYRVENFDFDELDADWIYISTLAGNFEVLTRFINSASKKGIKIAINPGKKELKKTKELIPLLKKVEVISVNKDEAKLLVKGEKDEEIARNMSSLAPISIITDGPNGSIATDSKTIVKAGMYEDVPVIDRTGAGDAFGSGFCAAVALGKSLADAVTFASANSTSVVGQVGAKAGILKQNQNLHDMPLEESDF